MKKSMIFVAVLLVISSTVSAACSFSSASWNETIVSEGTLVTLLISGRGNCRNEHMSVSVYEYDSGPLAPSDFVSTTTALVGNINWQTVFHDEDDLDLSPEYYFIASLVSDPSTTLQSSAPNLLVTPAFALQTPDTNGDSIVNVVDLVLIIQNYGQNPASGRFRHLDVTGDGRIDSLDSEAIIANL